MAYNIEELLALPEEERIMIVQQRSVIPFIRIDEFKNVCIKAEVISKQESE